MDSIYFNEETIVSSNISTRVCYDCTKDCLFLILNPQTVCPFQEFALEQNHGFKATGRLLIESNISDYISVSRYNISKTDCNFYMLIGLAFLCMLWIVLKHHHKRALNNKRRKAYFPTTRIKRHERYYASQSIETPHVVCEPETRVHEEKTQDTSGTWHLVTRRPRWYSDC